MSTSIAVAGKGGVGKTTLAALLVRLLSEDVGGPVLAVDADPNSNLNELLGATVNKTIGSVREGMLKDTDAIPAGMSKMQFVSTRYIGYW